MTPDAAADVPNKRTGHSGTPPRRLEATTVGNGPPPGTPQAPPRPTSPDKLAAKPGPRLPKEDIGPGKMPGPSTIPAERSVAAARERFSRAGRTARRGRQNSGRR